MPSKKTLLRAAAVLCLVALLPQSLSRAALVVLPAPELSVVLKGSDQIGLRYRYGVSASAPGDFDFQGDQLTALPLTWQERISRAGSVVALDALRAQSESYAEFQARVGVGQLSGLTQVRVENGSANASSFVYMQFIDVVQVDKGGKLDFNWSVSGTVDVQRNPFGTNFAGSSARAELFVWPYGTFPETGTPFPFTVYARSIFEPGGNTHLLPEVLSYPAGSRWWVLGQILMRSNAQSDHLLGLLPPKLLESTADFRHTAELFISPHPSTPEASFHSASGFDYAPPAIPEPSAYILMLAGAAVLALWLRLGMANELRESAGWLRPTPQPRP